MKIDDVLFAELWIGHTEYQVNLTEHKLFPSDGDLEAIDLKALEVRMDEGWEYTAYYDLDRKKVVEFPDDITTLPHSNIVGIILPAYKDLDPWQYAAIYGDKFPELLDNTSFKQACHNAIIVPIEQTFLPDIVRENLMENSIKINGKIFGLNSDRTLLISLENPQQTFSLKHMDMNPEGTEYMGFYDVNLGMAVHPNADNRYSKDLHLLIIPLELVKNPQRKDLQVKLIPVNKAPICQQQIRRKASNKKSKGKRI